MPPYGNITLAEIVQATERRAATGETVHPGFDFASLAPSPLKAARQEAEASDQLAESVAEPKASGIDGDLDNAWARLKRSINPS
jgi:hypothetical protein